MKKALIPIILILALLMGLALTACGDKESDATPDSASADQSATGDSRGTSSAVGGASSPSSASSEDTDEDSDENSNEDSKASGGSSAAAAPQQEAVQNDADDSGEAQEDTPAQEKKTQSGSAKQSSDSGSTSSVSPNPAYDDDHRPQFTIVLTDKSSKKEYSAACSYTSDKKDEAYASFFLPAGNYDIAVYEYADKIDKDNPLAESAYNNTKATKRKSIRVYYIPKDKKIEVKESASSRTQ